MRTKANAFLQRYLLLSFVMLFIISIVFFAVNAENETTEVPSAAEETTSVLSSAIEPETTTVPSTTTAETTEAEVSETTTAPLTTTQPTKETTTEPAEETTKPPLPPVEKVTLNLTNVKMGVGEKVTLKATVNKGAFCEKYVFASSNNKIVRVSENGIVEALAQGNAVITVTADENVKAECAISVFPAPKKISLNKTKITLGVGESFNFNSSVTSGCASYSRIFACRQKGMMSYHGNGVFKALKEGSATVTVTAFNGKKASCKVTILPAPDKVTINKTNLTLGVGETFNFNSSIPKGTASYKRTYSCGNKSLLSHSGSGFYKALKTGTTTVTVKTFNGKKASCKITVLPAPKKITINKTNLTLGVGETFNFNSSVPKGTASYKRTYSCGNKSLLSHSGSGFYKALKAGTTTVTVKTFNGKKASCKVTILPQPKKIYPANDTYTIPIGGKKQSKIQFPDGSYCSSFTYKSSDKSVAYCNSKGMIYAKKMGTAKITVTSLKGKQCSFTVKVRSMDVPFVSQVPKYPTGCEAASCTSLLRYYGYSITLDQMVDTIPRKSIYYKNGKRWGPDINEYFVGNPRGGYTSSDPGYGAFSPCVTKSLQKAIDKRNGEHTAVKISGCSFETLLSHISSGRPAIVWATYMMKVPSTVNSWYITETGKYFEYPRGTHVMVLTGYSENTVTIVDPYEGTCTFNKDVFEDRWNLLGNQAIIIK